MKVLLVEDRERDAAQYDKELRRLGFEVAIFRALDEFEAQIDELSDVVFGIFDQGIPRTTGDIPVADHGRAAHAQFIKQYPGIPTLVLSALPADPRFLVDNADQVDVWGTGDQRPLVDWVSKDELERFVEKASYISNQIELLNQVEVESDAALNSEQKRALRIFCRRHDVDIIRARKLTGGVSGALVLKVIGERQGATILNAVAKLGPRASVADEMRRFNQYVQLLEAGAYSHLHHPVVAHGCGSVGAAFYDLAAPGGGGPTETLFSSDWSGGGGAEAVQSIRRGLARWHEGCAIERRSVGDLIGVSISTTQALELVQSYGDTVFFPYAESISEMLHVLSNRSLQCRWSCQHGDLHGHNLMGVGSGWRLIDFGDVGPGPSVLDPITLELSMLFHIDRPVFGSWPSTTLDSDWRWWDASFLDYCPWPGLVRAVRDWTRNIAYSNREVFSVAAGYSLRQLKYDDTEKEWALKIAEECLQRLLDTYE